jgi:[protein-PII] uridylyltransferase
MTNKERFRQELDAIVKLHRSGSGGLRIALRLTRRLDNLLQRLLRELEVPSRQRIALVAVGGYGRKELCFASDIDIMFLIREESEKEVTAPVVHELLHRLLDYGLDIGHSFRTIDECLDLAATDADSWNSLLEARFICGNASTFALLRSRMRERIASYDRAAFIRQLLTSVELRHRKYGTSTKLLEPNIKNSAGGLRDLHTLLWLFLGTGRLKLRLGPTATAVTALLGCTFLRKQFNARALKQTRVAFDALLRVRNEMHLQASSLHDSLEFTFQRQVAEALNYRPTSTRTRVERFMHEYYVASRAIAQLTSRILKNEAERLNPLNPAAPHEALTEPFVMRRRHLALTRKRKKLTNTDALMSFLLSIDRQLPFSREVEDALLQLAARARPLRSKTETALLRELLNRPAGVSETLRMMNELGLLGRWIPEWKGLVAFFQHNIYHYYTADEHTLMVLAGIEQLRMAANSFGEVFRSLPRRDTLYLACLLHDIAKPKRIGDHEVIGMEMAGTILRRLHYEDVLKDVQFLVYHHLLMEQVAFRRNLSDPQTIVDFASHFERPVQLDYLYLLTYADLNAVNKNVWTDWKGMLLFELYKRTRSLLEERQTPKEYEERERQLHARRVQELVKSLSVSIPEAAARDHLQGFESPSYLATFSQAEIAEHIRRIGDGNVVAALFVQKVNYTEITILGQDAPFALSKFCGVLTANDANIFDAQIFTRTDGVIIDKFRVTDFLTKTALTREQEEKIQAELVDVLSGATDIEHLLHRHRMKWRRRAASQNPNIRIDVEFEEHPKYTIIDVYAPDMLGFLYKVTETISKLGLNISFAKIATRVDGIVDSFYVTDRTGSKIDDPERRAYIKQEILKTIADLTRSELVVQK